MLKIKSLNLSYLLMLCPILFTISCDNNEDDEVHHHTNHSSDVTAIAISDISPASGSDITGKVTFVEYSDGMVTMIADISGISEGEHGIHIHAVGDCSAEDASSAGGHWNPTNEDHGMWGSDAFHRGGIGNISIDSKGNGILSFRTDLWCISCNDDTKNILGKSMIIHQGADDFVSQPSGAAGARIGCGIIIKE